MEEANTTPLSVAGRSKGSKREVEELVSLEEVNSPMQLDEEDDDEEEEEEEEEVQAWEDWDAMDDGEPETVCVCLFCDSRFSSSDELLEHCAKDHYFDFGKLRKELKLDFYGSIKLLNYIRTQVAENKCWSCGLNLGCREHLLKHLHADVGFEKNGKFVWDDDMYLKPFMGDDALLHCIADDDMDEDGIIPPIDQEELAGMVDGLDTRDCVDNQDSLNFTSSQCCSLSNDPRKNGIEVCQVANVANHLEKEKSGGLQPLEDNQLKVSLHNVVARERRNINENYFGAYGTYGIHREMISDKARMDAYRGVILNNPSLMNQATVLDVGCGTGILSLFAAQAGASRVIAVEASKRISSMAKKIVEDNEFLSNGCQDISITRSGVIEVVHCMVEDLETVVNIPRHSIDVIVSEWMGYCLLFESMLTSVLYARDFWLKPGGAILPDTATIFAAGFCKGGTSLPFWEDVYGFDMSCIGNEVLEDAAKVPIVDVLESNDIVTETSIVQTFDLATMKPEEVDFTATFDLQLKPDISGNSCKGKAGVTWCYGIVLWFETGFTSRFCKEMPTVLTTSPYTKKTHWSQTIFTFREPIALTSSNHLFDESAMVGSERCPARRLGSRISIVRGSVHRSIDISLEVTGISMNDRKRNFPAQIFHLE